MGYPFFIKYNTIFNPDSKTVGFYDFEINYDSKGDDENGEEKANVTQNKNQNDRIWFEKKI